MIRQHGKRAARREANRKLVKERMTGTGNYRYENMTKAHMQLPKPVMIAGQPTTWLMPGQQFEGDSYFMCLVGQGLRYLHEVNPVTDEKLILNQPDRFTQEGKVEQVIPKKPLHEEQQTEPSKEVLINEDPLAGVDIIVG